MILFDKRKMLFEMFKDLFKSRKPKLDEPCTRPPKGWICTRGYHDGGPCAAVPATMLEDLHVVRVVEIRDTIECGVIGPFLTEQAALNWAVKHAVGNPNHKYVCEPLIKPY